MKKSLIILIVVAALIVIGGGVYWALNKPAEQIACTMEAKICPDGSAVGRTGPNCEFSPCPEIKESTTAKIDQKILNNGIYITPLEVIQDSRCPIDVQCIWAGTVTLRTKLESGANIQEVVLTLNKPVTFSGKQVELIDVAPLKNSKQNILPAEYIFEFSVTAEAGDEIGKGILEGQMTIGPICPVERIDNPCKPTAEMFAARKVFVYLSDKKP